MQLAENWKITVCLKYSKIYVPKTAAIFSYHFNIDNTFWLFLGVICAAFCISDRKVSLFRGMLWFLGVC